MYGILVAFMILVAFIFIDKIWNTTIRLREERKEMEKFRKENPQYKNY